MAHYILQYPPHTKVATAVYSHDKKLLLVTCPHCGGAHYRQPKDANKLYVEASCKKDYFYTIKVS